jgi:hypothetical protein
VHSAFHASIRQSIYETAGTDPNCDACVIAGIAVIYEKDAVLRAALAPVFRIFYWLLLGYASVVDFPFRFVMAGFRKASVRE